MPYFFSEDILNDNNNFIGLTVAEATIKAKRSGKIFVPQYGDTHLQEIPANSIVGIIDENGKVSEILTSG